MQKFLSLFLVITSLVVAIPPQTFASAFDDTIKETVQFSSKLIFKGSHSNELVKAVFNSSGNLALSYSQDGELKLWDTVNLKLLKTHQINQIKDIAWLSGTNNFVVLTKDKATFYKEGFESYGAISNESSHPFEQMASFHTKDQIAVTQRNLFTVYDSEGVEKGKASIKDITATNILISPNDQDLILISNQRRKLYLYNTNNLDYQREIGAAYSPVKSKMVIVGKELWIQAEKGINRTQLSTGVTHFTPLENWTNHDKNYNFIQADKNYFIYNDEIYTPKKLKLALLDTMDNYQILTEGKVSFIDASSLVYNEAARQLIALKDKDIYIYDLSALYSEKNQSTVVAPLVISKPEPKPEPQIKIAAPTKAIEVERLPPSTPEPKKPIDITISASVTEGIAPLDVTFLLNSARPEMVAATYSNIANKEQLHEGIPLAIKHTFTKPGKHSAVFAFRTAEGKVVKDSVLIDVRKESFEDYKKRTLGH